MFYDFEGRSVTESQKVLRTQSRVKSWQELQAQLQVLHAECATGEAARIRSMVKEIVPQYQWEWAPAEDSHRKPVQSKRPEFPSGITLGMQPTIQSWFSQRVGERRVAHGDGDR
jgi:hypothetical protein